MTDFQKHMKQALENDNDLLKLGFKPDAAYKQIGKQMRKIYTSNPRYRLFDLENDQLQVNLKFWVPRILTKKLKHISI